MKNKEEDPLERILGDSNVREFQDPVDKAAYIVQNYVPSEKLTKETIQRFFHVDHHVLQKRVWSLLLGYTKHNKHKPRYLSPKYEGELTNFIKQRWIDKRSMSKEEVLQKVMKNLEI